MQPVSIQWREERWKLQPGFSSDELRAGKHERPRVAEVDAGAVFIRTGQHVLIKSRKEVRF